MLPSPSTSNNANALLSFVISSLGNFSSNIISNDGYKQASYAFTFLLRCYIKCCWYLNNGKNNKISSFLANYLFTSVCGQTKSQYQNIVKWRWSKMSNFSAIQQICYDNEWKTLQFSREICLGSSKNQYFLWNIIERKLLFSFTMAGMKPIMFCWSDSRKSYINLCLV